MEQALVIEAMTQQTQNEMIRRTVGKERTRLMDFIRRRVRSEEDAEDILQDVFYQFVGASRLEPIEQATNWLFRVAGNRIIDWYRKKKTASLEELNTPKGEGDDDTSLHLEDILFDPSEMPDRVLLRQTVWRMLEESLAELPKDQREVFILNELEGRSFQEIAEMTGEKINTLLSRKRYAVLYLRKQLRVLYDEYFND